RRGRFEAAVCFDHQQDPTLSERVVTNPCHVPASSLMSVKRGTLAEALPGFGQARPRKDFRMDDLGQNLETLDDPWTRAIEVRGAVHRIDPPLLNSAETAPFDRKVDVRELLDGAL